MGEARTVELSGHFSDPDGDALAYAVTSSDEAVAAASVSGGVLTVAAIAKGGAAVSITATDTEGLAATQEFAVTVPNRAPIAGDAIAERTIEVDGNAALELSDHFSDPDGDALGYAATSSDEAVAVVSVSGTTLTVTAIAKGGASVLVTATDTEGVAATQEFPVTVPNRPPLPGESIPGHDIAVGETATLELSGHFSDPDGDALVYAATSSDQAVAVVSVSEGTLTISVIAKGGAVVTVTATDPEGLAAAQEFAVSAPNRAPLPVGSIAARTLDVGKIATLELSGHFSDPDGDVLTYAATVSDPEVAGISVVDGVADDCGGCPWRGRGDGRRQGHRGSRGREVVHRDRAQPGPARDRHLPEGPSPQGRDREGGSVTRIFRSRRRSPRLRVGKFGPRRGQDLGVRRRGVGARDQQGHRDRDDHRRR